MKRQILFITSGSRIALEISQSYKKKAYCIQIKREWRHSLAYILNGLDIMMNIGVILIRVVQATLSFEQSL